MIGGGGGTAFPNLSAWAGLCLHPDIGMRSVLFARSIQANPSYRSCHSGHQRRYESLQGKPEVSLLLTPRRCPTVPIQRVRFHRCELRFLPVFTDWRDPMIEPASASPLPSVLHVYPVYCFNHALPDRQGRRAASPYGFSALAPGEPLRDPVRYDARNLNAPARLQSDGTLLGFKQRVRSCRRWQLIDCRWIYEVTAPRHAPSVSRPTSKPSRPQGSVRSIRCDTAPTQMKMWPPTPNFKHGLAIFKNAQFITLPVALFFRLALIVLLLALGET